MDAVTGKLVELADLHNRRDNVEFVSRRAKELGIPFLTWPEDKELLRVADLPISAGNRAPAWSTCKRVDVFPVFSDQSLRDVIKIGYGYTVIGRDLNHGVVFVAEYEIKSK